MQEVSTASYWIASNALYITLNANGAPNYILGNTASGAHILCYVKGVDGLEYDAAHNYRRWPLSLTPTKFNTNTEKYVYVAIPRPTNPETTAVVVFPSEKLDLYGKNEAGRQIGSELYYYVWLRGIITATNAGETLERAWQQHVETGTLSSDEAIDAGGDQTWWRYSSVDDTVTFLKEIVMDAKSVFHNLKARILVLAGHELTGVATAETSEEFVDSETLVVTPNYLRKMTEDKFLRKDQDDATPYSLSVGGDLNVSGALHGIMGYFTSLFSNLLQSSNYTGDGAADTGFRLTADDGSGSSSMIVDVLHVRKKAIFEELEVKKEMSVAGNEVRSAAANIINRTDYINGQGEVIGYSYTRVPWMLRKMPFLLRGTFFGRLRKTRLVIDPQDVQNIQKIRCYFLAKDGDRDVQNLWQVGDLVRCQTFNLSQSKRYTYIDSATQNKPGNVFWWRKSVGVSTQTENIDGKDYHYVDVSMSDRWHTNTVDSDIPCAGDHMVQFGHDSNPDRMNLIVQEVNSSDAPAVKAYMGIYTYDESECWWGGTPRKMMVSPKSGYEFYGPSFKFIQEYGQAPASIDRGVYTEIATERDDFNTHGQVRKLYYYDKVSHNGCYWLCVMTGVGAHWVAKVAFTETVGGTTYTFSAGDYIPDNVYSGLVTNKTNCTRKENYTTEAPSETSTSWKKLVNSGDNMIRLDIDNELDAVQTDSTCKVTAQRTITTNVRLYDGATEVAINNPTVTAISYTDANGQQQTLNPVITASGNGKQLSWTFLAGWTLQARYQVNISYTYLDVPYTAVFTLTASQGFEVLQLKPSLSAISFQRDASNQLTPASRTLGLSIVKIDGASTADITPATYGVSKIRYSLTEMPALISSGSAWPAAGTITVPNTAENVYIALFNIFDVLIDRETVPVIKDGEKGQKGDSVAYDEEHSSIGYAYSSMGTPEAGRDYPSDITSWNPTPPAVQKGKYLWTKDVTAYNNAGTIVYTTTYGVQYQPNDGESVEIDSSRTFIKYCRQTKSQYTGQHPADSDFSTTYPTNLGQGDYLWILNQVAYVGVANPLKSYSVSMLGTDGGKGDPGADGYTTHFAYATSADGSQNFSTTNFNGATYIGTYRDQQANDSTDYRDYVWTPWKGEKGDSVSYDSEHSSIGYAYSSMGTPEAGRDYPSDITSWSPTPPAVQKGKYLWTKDVTAYNNAGTIVYTTTYGVQYQPNDGDSVEIDSSRTFIKYCRQTKSQYTGQHPADSDFSTTYPTNLGQGDYLWILNQVAYVGVANPLKSYSVSMLGMDGGKGDPGADGYTTHFAYATSADGSQNFSTTNFNGATYIGTYRDQLPNDSTDYRDYVWTPWKGDPGAPGSPGAPGEDGKDAVNVSLSPEEVIVTQATSAPYGIDLSNAETVVSVNEGGVPKSFTISNVSGTHCQAAVKSGTIDTIKITQIDTYNTTVDGETVARYYDNGYVTFDVTYGSNTYHKRFNFYANLLGTWKREVEGGVETVVANVVDYDFLDDKLTKNNKSYTQIASAAQEFSQWASAYQTASGQSVNNLNTRISNSEGDISTLQKRTYGDVYADASSHMTKSQLEGIKFFADAGNYMLNIESTDATVSGSGTNLFIYKESGGSAIKTLHIEDGEGVENEPVVFTEEGIYYISIDDEFESGAVGVYNISLKWEQVTSSQVKQTADEIDLSIRNDLSSTGININGSTKKIIAKANNFEFQNSSGSKTIEVDSNGNLKTSGNAQFEGKVKATSGEFTGKVTSGEGEIGGFTITSNEIKSEVSANESLTLNKDGSFTIINGSNSVKMNTNGFEVMFGGEGFRVGDFGTGHQGMERWDSVRNVWAAMYERKIAHINKTATTVNLGNLPGVNYVLNARVDGDNHTLVLLPPVSEVPNGASIIVRGLARDCDATVRVANTNNDAMLIGDYKVTETGILAADCAEFIMCKGINSYIKPSQWSAATLYIQDAWICNYYDRDV